MYEVFAEYMEAFPVEREAPNSQPVGRDLLQTPLRGCREPPGRVLQDPLRERAKQELSAHVRRARDVMERSRSVGALVARFGEREIRSYLECGVLALELLQPLRLRHIHAP